jgi:hypothetical protein
VGLMPWPAIYQVSSRGWLTCWLHLSHTAGSCSFCSIAGTFARVHSCNTRVLIHLPPHGDAVAVVRCCSVAVTGTLTSGEWGRERGNYLNRLTGIGSLTWSNACLPASLNS